MSRISVSKLVEAELEIGLPIEISATGKIHHNGCIGLRFGYWNRLSQAQLSSLQEVLGVDSSKIYEDLYEDDDGDGDNGKPIIRHLWSYIIQL